MKKNFIVGQSNEVVKDNNFYDLHNIYNFVEIRINTEKSQLKIIFQPIDDFQKQQSSIVFVFHSLDYLELSKGFGTRKITTLEEVGYKEPNDYDTNWILSENQSSPEDHLFFRLSKDDYVRVYSKTVNLLVS